MHRRLACLDVGDRVSHVEHLGDALAVERERRWKGRVPANAHRIEVAARPSPSVLGACAYDRTFAVATSASASSALHRALRRNELTV
jgi:hypothetical protein